MRSDFWGRLRSFYSLPSWPSDRIHHWRHADACFLVSHVADANLKCRASRLLDLNVLQISSQSMKNLKNH